jgi:opacity protein-like surface antigen
MNKLLKGVLSVAVLMFGITAVVAQDDRVKWEGYAGYSYMNLNRGIDADEFDDDLGDTPANRVNAHGFNGSITYNFSRFVGAKFDLTLHSHGEDFAGIAVVNPLPTVVAGGVGTPAVFKTSQNVYQYMGGIQIKDNNKDGAKFKPWAHLLLGIADQHFSVDQTSPTNVRIFDVNSTDWAMKFGGGLDYQVHKNVDIRFIQFDWNPIWRGDQDFGPNIGVVNGVMQNNWLIGFGVVLKN